MLLFHEFRSPSFMIFYLGTVNPIKGQKQLSTVVITSYNQPKSIHLNNSILLLDSVEGYQFPIRTYNKGELWFGTNDSLYYINVSTIIFLVQP